MCDEFMDDKIKNLIYKNKVVIFGVPDDEMSVKAKDFFKLRFKFEAMDVNLMEENKLVECLKKRTKTNLIPMVYVNGMFIGSYKNIVNIEYRKEFDILF
jgi:glutaredoxin-related protein